MGESLGMKDMFENKVKLASSLDMWTTILYEYVGLLIDKVEASEKRIFDLEEILRQEKEETTEWDNMSKEEKAAFWNSVNSMREIKKEDQTDFWKRRENSNAD